MSEELNPEQQYRLDRIKKMCEIKASNAADPSQWYVVVDYDVPWRIRNALEKEGLQVMAFERKNLKHVYGCGCDMLEGPDQRCWRYWKVGWEK
jgi:hypothetical protein